MATVNRASGPAPQHQKASGDKDGKMGSLADYLGNAMVAQLALDAGAVLRDWPRTGRDVPEKVQRAIEMICSASHGHSPRHAGLSPPADGEDLCPMQELLYRCGAYVYPTR